MAYVRTNLGFFFFFFKAIAELELITTGGVVAYPFGN